MVFASSEMLCMGLKIFLILIMLHSMSLGQNESVITFFFENIVLLIQKLPIPTLDPETLFYA
jgi:hypothetical protein